jgi:hypothetical protein
VAEVLQSPRFVKFLQNLLPEPKPAAAGAAGAADAAAASLETLLAAPELGERIRGEVGAAAEQVQAAAAEQVQSAVAEQVQSAVAERVRAAVAEAVAAEVEKTATAVPPEGAAAAGVSREEMGQEVRKALAEMVDSGALKNQIQAMVKKAARQREVTRTRVMRVGEKTPEGAEIDAARPATIDEELLRKVVDSDDFKAALDQRFRAVLDYLRTEVIPREIEKHAGGRGG